MWRNKRRSLISITVSVVKESYVCQKFVMEIELSSVQGAAYCPSYKKNKSCAIMFLVLFFAFQASLDAVSHFEVSRNRGSDIVNCLD